MRKELEQMQAIENYINGSLSEADKMAFEKQLSTDPTLQKELQLQRELLQGIKRTAIKQTVKTGLKKYKFNRNLKNFGLGGLAVIAITAGAFLFYNSVIKTKTNENAAQELPELNEQGQKLWSDADKYLPSQQFELNTEKDTVIETQDGIVLAIPAHSFLDAGGRPATGSIQLEMKEALNAAEIMKAGLNTKSGDKLLETGGMFYINARQDNASLKIDPNNPLYAEIPTNEVKPNMQLFEGKRLPDGTIDWVNPKPLQKDLIPVDILSLNFYPPNYLDSLKSCGYNTKDKAFTDSLYYSFAARFGNLSLSEQDGSIKSDSSHYEPTLADTIASSVENDPPVYGDAGAKIFMQNCAVCHSLGKNKITGPGLAGVLTRVPSETWLRKFIANNYALIASGDPYANKIYNENNKAAMTVFGTLSDKDMTDLVNFIKGSTANSNGINPAKIKTIWNRQFQNTLLATREFEARLPLIFSTCDENVLDLYVNNLDKNLSGIDSLAFSVINNSQFLQFAARGDGKVKNGNKNVQLLKKYYKEKSRIFTEAITITQNKFSMENIKEDAAATEKRNDHSEKDALRLSENFQKEFDLNLREAYHQLGYGEPGKPITPRVRAAASTYGTPITSTGWCNIDSYTLAATANRTTIDYTDRETGKRAVIKYEPLTVTIANSQNYDRVLVYLLPDELNSFMRVNNKNDVFEEKLDELMTYKMVCIAYKSEESFYYSQDNIKPGSIAVSLVKTTNLDIQNNVNKLSNHNQSTAMNDELNYLGFEKQETKRKAQLVKIKELTNKVMHVIFPCMSSAPAPAPATEYIYQK